MGDTSSTSDTGADKPVEHTPEEVAGFEARAQSSPSMPT